MGIFSALRRLNLVAQILMGLVLGAVIALISPEAGRAAGLLGTLFVGALKAIAPLLVLVLVIAALVNQRQGEQNNTRDVLALYALGTFAAALSAVLFSFLFPTTIPGLTTAAAASDIKPPSGVLEVLQNLLLNFVANPLRALLEGNYIGVLFWAALLGLALRNSASDTTKRFFADAADAVSALVRWVIAFAPLGILGLVASTVAETGLSALATYGRLMLVLVGCMLFIALVLNPLIVWWKLRRNPYPLVFTCLAQSGLTAFFTRSSAANIPVNLALCERLGLEEDTYSVSIPLGATINMAGAATTINVMALAAAHTLGIQVDLPTALLLAVVGAVSAAGASGVAGGSLLLIPVACSLFGIPAEIAMKMVGVGFIIGVVQDSCETALNSSTDVLFTAAADLSRRPTASPV